ncbi:MAG: Phosphate acyltransferase [Firmicutes bacterium ADurb.Bin193]|nr:MAG: Phosphate acyltransferase [Firmicutes bacterium ADurb.Bin193]
MKIIVDAMGGDNAPAEIVKGCMLAVQNLGVEIILTGDEEKIKKHLTDDKNITIVQASEVITYEDSVNVVRQKTDSSMVVGLNLLAKGEGDAFVSAGNSGALIAGATLIVKRIKGIRRVALAPIIPTNGKSTILIDCGANVDCTPELLEQFAIMGNAYSKAVLGVENPRVGLLSNGTEEHKGNEKTRAAYGLISALPLNFVGNIEARDILDGVVDVLVADGFEGNILLKAIEGTALYFSKNLKEMFMKNIITKLCGLMLKGGLSGLKKKFDYNEHGGAPVLGACGAVIKAHGSSKALALSNAIRQAKKFYEAKAIESITNLVNQ